MARSAAVHRRPDRRGADPCPLGGWAAAGNLGQNRHRPGVTDVAAPGFLSAPERPCPGTSGNWSDRADAVHPRLARGLGAPSAGHRRVEQGRIPERAGARRLLPPPWPEIHDRSYEGQQHRASGLNLVVAAIILWNTVYLARAVEALRRQGEAIGDDLLTH